MSYKQLSINSFNLANNFHPLYGLHFMVSSFIIYFQKFWFL